MGTFPRLRLMRHLPALVVGVAYVWLNFGATPTYAQNNWRLPLPESGPANTGNWFDAANWSASPQPEFTPAPIGVPTAAQIATVGNAPPANIAAGAAVANELIVNQTNVTVAEGALAPSAGQVVINGTNASLTLFGTGLPLSLDVQSGSVLVQNGGTLTTFRSAVGRIADADATPPGGVITHPLVSVSGVGSRWVESGTLTIGLLAQSQVTVADGASFQGAQTVNVGALGQINIGSGGLAGTFNAPAITNNGTINFNFTDSTTLSAQVSGTGRILKLGSGTLTLTGNNSYSGGTTVTNGTLVAAANNALGAGPVTVTGPSSLVRIAGGASVPNSFAINNGATLDNSGNVTAGVSSTGGGTLINESNGQISAPAGETSTAPVTAVTVNGGPAIFSNAGTITGNVTFDNFANRATLITGGTITGNLNLGPNAGSVLILDGSGTQTVSQAVTGTITNSGSLVKQGSGNWIIDFDRELSAPISANVLAGIFTVNGTLNSPVVNVQAGGTLRGSGTITGTVTNFGNLTPGNSPGTLTISGNFTQTSTGTYNVEIASATNYSRLVVGGHASLDGTLRLTLSSGFRPRPTDQFAILTAGGGITGTFRTVIGPNGVPIRVIYTNGAVDVIAGTPLTAGTPQKAEPEFHLSDGTPISTTALMANSMFYDFGSLAEQLAESGKGNAIGITFDAGEFYFEGHHGEEYGFPITGQFKINDRVQLNYAIPLQYVQISHTSLFQAGLTVDLPVKVIIPSPVQPFSWVVTPTAAFATSGSKEIIGAGALTNVFAYRWPWMILTYGNYISFFKGHTFTSNDAQFATGVDQQIMKNGLKVDVPFAKSWMVECYGIYTQFFQSAAVSSYFTIGAEVGHHFTWDVEGQHLDLGYLSFGFYSDIGNHYSSGHLRMGSAWRF